MPSGSSPSGPSARSACWGESYKAEVFDDLIPQVLDRVQVGAVTLTQVIDGLTTYPDTTFAVARIRRERETAWALPA